MRERCKDTVSFYTTTCCSTTTLEHFPLSPPFLLEHTPRTKLYNQSNTKMCFSEEEGREAGRRGTKWSNSNSGSTRVRGGGVKEMVGGRAGVVCSSRGELAPAGGHTHIDKHTVSKRASTNANAQ